MTSASKYFVTSAFFYRHCRRGRPPAHHAERASDDRTAISDTRHVVTPEHQSVVVARGSGGDVEFLGVWDWSDGQARWTPEE